MLATCSVLLCSCVATTEVCLLLRRKCVCCYDGSVFVATTEMCLLLRQKCVCCYYGSVFVATTEVCLLLRQKCVCRMSVILTLYWAIFIVFFGLFVNIK